MVSITEERLRFTTKLCLTCSFKLKCVRWFQFCKSLLILAKCYAEIDMAVAQSPFLQICLIVDISILLESSTLKLDCEIYSHEITREPKSSFMKICVIVPQLSWKRISNKNKLLEYPECVNDKMTQITARALEMTSISRRKFSYFFFVTKSFFVILTLIDDFVNQIDLLL